MPNGLEWSSGPITKVSSTFALDLLFGFFFIEKIKEESLFKFSQLKD